MVARIDACLALSLVLGCGTAAAQPITATATGQQTVGWNFPNGALPTPVGAVKTYTGNAFSGATADNTPGASSTVTGTKLTYTSTGMAAGLPTGTWTSGQVGNTDQVNPGPLGSTAVGNTLLRGSHTAGGGNTAKVTIGAIIMPSAAVGAMAQYVGIGWDPYDFAMMGGGAFPAGTALDINLELEDDTDLPSPGTPGVSWTATYSGVFKNIATSDVDVFWGSNPDLLYSLTITGNQSGIQVQFTPGLLALNQTPAQIEANVVSALASGWSGSLGVLSGSLDVGGLSEGSVGYYSRLEVNAVGVPSPGSAALLTLAGACIVRRRRPS